MEMTSSTASDQSNVTAIIITTAVCVVTMTIVISLVLSAVVCVCCRHRNRSGRSDIEETIQSDSRISSFQGADCEAIIPQVETIDSLVQASLNFGNYSSLSLLIQRHIVKRTKLEKNIEKTPYFEKYVGLWRREQVLVKVYPAKYEGLWFSETEMFQTPCMRHDNIACFVAADILQQSAQLKHYVILRHYEQGCLAEHLSQTVLDVPSALRLAESLAGGLAHLHCEVVAPEHGGVLKPMMAHRNITSRSVYVTDHGTCCIADLSLAVKATPTMAAELKLKPQGAVRYLAPEILGGQLNIESDVGGTTLPHPIEDLKRADMYSFSLVLWEILQRCSVEGSAVEDPVLPYVGVVSEDPPSTGEMRVAVCEQGLRPPLNECWDTNESLQVVVKAMTECWHGNPAIRSTSAHVSKTLQNLVSQVKPVSDKNGKLLQAYNLS